MGRGGTLGVPRPLFQVVTMTQRLRWTGVLLSLPFLAVLAAHPSSAAAPHPKPRSSPRPPPQAQQAESEAPFPLPVLEISGSPEALGTRHGQQLGDTIRSLHNDYLNAYFKARDNASSP